MQVVIVGAGVAGLVCARTLHRAGIAVTVLEASDGAGGRIRSDRVEGFTLDRGFQVLFTAYPVAARQLDYGRLDLRRFDPGAVVAQGTTRHLLADPIRDPGALIPSLLTGIVTPADKLLTARLSAELLTTPIQTILTEPDETTAAYLVRYGFSDAFIENFARPFFGSIYLEDDLRTSSRAFRYDWKMLASGDTVVPKGGMGQISRQLAEELTAAERVRLSVRAESLVRSAGGQVTGVVGSDGETYSGDIVILATPAPEAARLTGLPMPEGSTSVITLYFAGEAPVYPEKKVALHANQHPFVRSAVQITNVAPEYAPPGKCLLGASVLGLPEGDEDMLFARAYADLRRMWTGDKDALTALDTYRPIALYRIPYGQFAQPPGVYETLPDNDSGIPGLLFAAEFTAASSLNAAMRSGEKAAARVLAITSPPFPLSEAERG